MKTLAIKEIQDILSVHHKRKAAFNELVDVIVNLKTQGSLVCKWLKKKAL
ncbi:hypothetical protein VN0682_09490 [Helicobacter pylori]|nr:hypothetical protein VN0682_09490 [Helicobacter pylori]